MNKNLFIVAVLIMCFTACSKTNQKNTLQYEGLKGQVKSTFSYCYEAKCRFGKIEKGDIARTSVLPEWSNLYPAYQREYNSDGNITKISTYFQDGETYKVTKIEYIGDKIASICTYDYEGNILYSEKYSYNRGKLMDYEKSLYYDKHHDITHKYEIVNNKVVADSSFVKGELSRITLYNDDNEFTHVSTTIDTEGNESDKSIITKDKFGRTIKIECRGNSWEGYLMQNTYNEVGWISSIIREESGKIKELVFDYQGYDKIGNWISRVIYIDGELEALEERKIEYY